jgi:hypothetical protein
LAFPLPCTMCFTRVILSSLESDYHPFVALKATSVVLDFIFSIGSVTGSIISITEMDCQWSSDLPRLSTSRCPPLHPSVNWLLIVFFVDETVETSCQCLRLPAGSDQVYLSTNRTIEWELFFLLCLKIACSENIKTTLVYLTPPVLQTTQRQLNTEQLISLTHPHHQWTLSPISSTFSLPLMRVCPRMRKAALAAELTLRCVSLHEIFISYVTTAMPFYTSL